MWESVESMRRKYWFYSLQVLTITYTLTSKVCEQTISNWCGTLKQTHAHNPRPKTKLGPPMWHLQCRCTATCHIPQFLRHTTGRSPSFLSLSTRVEPADLKLMWKGVIIHWPHSKRSQCMLWFVRGFKGPAAVVSERRLMRFKREALQCSCRDYSRDLWEPWAHHHITLD